MTRPSSRLPALLALSVSLRAARTARGLGLRRLADKLGIPAQYLSLWENGKRPPSTDEIAHLLGFLQVGPAEYNRIMRLHRQLDNPSVIVTVEPDADSLQRTFEQFAIRTLEWAPRVIPEPLQAPEYIRAILQGRATRPDDIDQEIFTRQVRKLDRDRNHRHTVLLCAAALHPEFGLPPNGISADLPHVDIRIVPAKACVTGTIEPFMIFEFEDKASTVVLRHQHNAIFLTEHDTVSRYRSTFRSLEKQAAEYRSADSR